MESECLLTRAPRAGAHLDQLPGIANRDDAVAVFVAFRTNTCRITPVGPDDVDILEFSKNTGSLVICGVANYS